MVVVEPRLALPCPEVANFPHLPYVNDDFAAILLNCCAWIVRSDELVDLLKPFWVM